jgi:hypothetical protein
VDVRQGGFVAQARREPVQLRFGGRDPVRRAR